MTRQASRGLAVLLAGALAAPTLAGCARRQGATPPSNSLLVIGYDREPDPINRIGDLAGPRM